MFTALLAEEPDRIRLYLARHEGDLVAATVWIRVGGHTWYSYGASSTEKRDVRGSNAVQWAMIRDSLAAGADVYDLRGITDTLDPDDSHVGLIQFKVGTGGEAVEYAGEWDLPLNPLVYKAFSALHEQEVSPMPLTLYVDGARWRAHLQAVRDPHPGIVPVLKGNGYGFGSTGSPSRAAWLGVDTVAVGMYSEVTRVAERFTGSSWCSPPGDRSRPAPSSTATSCTPSAGSRTCGRWPRTTAGRGSCSSGLTSMRRHGFSARDLREARRARSTGVAVEGVAFHLPISQGSHLTEVNRLMTDVVAAGLPTRPGLRLPPDRHRAGPAAAVLPGLRVPARGSAPSSGSATATRCGFAPPSSTCTRSSAATSTATAAARPRRPARSWWCPEARRTASASRRPPAARR